MAKTKQNPPIAFEPALKELEGLVEKMEKGETTLEQSLSDFERGIELVRLCQSALENAEQKVQILLEKNKQAKPQAFEADKTSDNS